MYGYTPEGYRFEKKMKLNIEQDEQKEIVNGLKKIVHFIKSDRHFSIENLIDTHYAFARENKFLLTANYNLNEMFQSIVKINIEINYWGFNLFQDSKKADITLKGNYHNEIEKIEKRIFEVYND